MGKLIKCEICGKTYSHMGIHTHMQRAHGTDEEKRKYSDGNNGKYDDLSYKQKIRQALTTFYIKKNGLKVDLHLKCEKCGTEFVKVDYAHKKHQHRFCSRSCANSRNHTTDTKQKISKKLLEISNTADFRQKISKRRSGKKLLKIDNLTNICINCGKITKNKKFCSKACKIEHYRSSADAKSLYRQDCKFDFSLNEYPDYFDFSLIKKHGWYKPSNRGGNGRDGVSRDHIYSVMDGFRNNIDPKIIKHPANCRLILQSENFNKKDESHLTIEQLLEKINEFNIKYDK